ncbi:hypothetical protein C8J57DRAFT_1525535 [Mycena rebaudengoi]|nr:hypothetical protein C8J57DRAFT_1525535 [Mycena rebaudengoi]
MSLNVTEFSKRVNEHPSSRKMDTISSAFSFGQSSDANFAKHVKTLIAEANILRIDSQIKDLMQLLANIILDAADSVDAFVSVKGTLSLWAKCLKMFVAKSPTESYIAGTAAWLERSAPLAIPVFIALMPTTHRWRSLILRTGVSHSLIHDFPLDAFKNLEQLHLTGSDSGSGDSPASKCLLPWTQLTDVDIRTDSPYNCLKILLQCASVVSAKFTTLAWEAPPNLSDIAITTLPHLQTLNVQLQNDSEDDEPHFSSFFACLALPALTTLKLSFHHNVDWVCPEFTDFQKRCPNLEQLDLVGCSLDADDLKAMLIHASLLTHLSVEQCLRGVDDHVLGALKYASGSHLTPRLQYLSLELRNNIDESALEEMILSRWRSDAQLLASPLPQAVERLKVVYLSFEGAHEFSDNFQTKMDGYYEEGLKIFYD